MKSVEGPQTGDEGHIAYLAKFVLALEHWFPPHSPELSFESQIT